MHLLNYFLIISLYITPEMKLVSVITDATEAGIF